MLTRRPSPALVLAALALFVALGGTAIGQDAVSAAKRQITGSDATLPAVEAARPAVDTAQWHSGTLRYWKDRGVVHMQGHVNAYTVGTPHSQPFVTLPEGYRPSDELRFPALVDNRRLIVVAKPDGTVGPFFAGGESFVDDSEVVWLWIQFRAA